jgi:hypothetical protein
MRKDFRDYTPIIVIIVAVIIGVSLSLLLSNTI